MAISTKDNKSSTNYSAKNNDLNNNINIRTDENWLDCYYELKDARNSARDNERKMQLGYADLPVIPLWEKVITLTSKITQANIYDLEIAVWFTEAKFRTENVMGLTQGLDNILQLITNHWDDLHPMPDEDGLSTRLISLYGLNGIESEGSLIQPLREIVITDSEVSNNFCFAEYKTALELEKKPEHKNSTNSLYKQILSSSKQTNSEFYIKLKNSLNLSLDSYLKIISYLDELCKNDSPPSSYIKSTLNELIECLNYLSPKENVIKDSQNNSDIHNNSQENNTDDNQRKNSNQTNTQSKINSNIKISEKTTPFVNNSNYPEEISCREQALGLLHNISEFFSKAEPHSPLPFLINRAIKWGNMALPELLTEMITDKNARDNACHLTGVPSVNQNSSNNNADIVQNNITQNNNMNNNQNNNHKVSQTRFT